MTLIERESCCATGKSDLEPLYEFPSFPVFMGCVDQPQVEDLKQDMSWYISRSSGLIQLKKLLPLNILYPESHGAGTIGLLWATHHKAFASFVNKSRPSAVLEIGGSHGILEKEYHRFGEIPWTILEPNPSPIDECKARFIKGFFDQDFKYSEEFDTIIHSHVLEHIYEPAEFIKHLSEFMNNGKKLIFSIPNMKSMLDKKYTNCLDFEHTIFITEPYVEYLLSKYGFKLVGKEYFMDDHSIFYSFVRDRDVKSIPLPGDLYRKNKAIFMNYVTYYKNLIRHINKYIDESSQPIYVFGAHVFTQFLLEMGLNTEKVICILDNDTKKQGRRLYGTGLTVDSPKILSVVIKPIVILNAGVYNKEIRDDIVENINSDTIFLDGADVTIGK